ncbi:MAG: ubiquitin-like small modifier protein 2 [Halobacteriales archaeon]|nr:ubiquitin-like small modifier protein 2 [Halobacteriales archaeon]
MPGEVNVEVEVDVVGGDTHRIVPDGNTYADLLAAIDLSPHEAAVLVDGQPVPEDAPIDTEHVRVLRLIKGGSDVRTGWR